MSRTVAVLQAFIAAYNRHDLPATMAFFPHTFTENNWVDDCDYAFLHPVELLSYRQIKAWFRVRFAEGDRFVDVRIQASNPSAPMVGGLFANRTSDVLAAMGTAPLIDPYGAKIALDNAHGEIIQHMWFPGLDSCQRMGEIGPFLRFPPGASLMRTRAVAQAFIDAYNDHDLPRLLQLVTRHVTYRGCDWASGTDIEVRGRARLKTWLRALFASGDRYDRATLAAANPGEPNVAEIQGQRTNRALQQQGRAPLAASLNAALPGPRYDRIGSLTAGACSP